MAEAGCDGNRANVKDTGDDLELARQLDFDSESLPVDDQQRETDSSHLHGNGAGEIQTFANSGQDTSQVIGSSCPTPTAQHKVRPNTLWLSAYHGSRDH